MKPFLAVHKPMYMLHTAHCRSVLDSHSLTVSWTAQCTLLHRMPRPTGFHIQSFRTSARCFLNVDINGPPTTRPAILNVPGRGPAEGPLHYNYRRGKAYAVFYMTGIKHVFSNFDAARSIRRRIRYQHGQDIEKAIEAKELTRREYLTLMRTSRDMRKIPIFVLIVMLTGEFSPLILLFFTGLVPGPCLSPTQIARIREKLQVRPKAIYAKMHSSNILPGGAGVNIAGMNRQQLRLIGATLGLYSARWDRFEAVALPPTFWIRARAQKAIKDLDLDDRLLSREGAVAELELEEVMMALSDRGIDVRVKTDADLRDELQAWITARKTASVEALTMHRFGK